MDRFNEINDSFDEAIYPLKGALRAIEVFSESINKLVGPINENIAQLGAVLVEAFKPFAAARKLGDAQYVYWDYLESDFIDLLIESSNADDVLREHNKTDEYRTLENTISLCSSHTLMAPYIRLFTQSILAYRVEEYDLTVVGLLSISDGLLTDVSGDITTSIYKRAMPIMERVKNDESLDDTEFAIIMLLITFQKTMEILSAKIDFSKMEPKNLNRHWIMHGRSRRMKTRLDCIKLINFIYGILLINDFTEQEVGSDE